MATSSTQHTCRCDPDSRGWNRTRDLRRCRRDSRCARQAVYVGDAGGGRGRCAEARRSAAACAARQHPPRKQALKGPLTTPIGGGFRSVNVRLREEFKLYANLRPARTDPGGRYDDIDLVLVRENLEDFTLGSSTTSRSTVTRMQSRSLPASIRARARAALPSSPSITP